MGTNTATERLQQTIQALRFSLANERKVYHNAREMLEVYYPNEWKVVADAVKDVALYYHGEIVRAKHDLADWIQGHEVHGTYGDRESVDEIHTLLKVLPELLDVAGKLKARYDSERSDSINSSTAKLQYENAEREVQAAIDMIKDMAKDIEEHCYAER